MKTKRGVFRSQLMLFSLILSIAFFSFLVFSLPVSASTFPVQQALFTRTFQPLLAHQNYSLTINHSDLALSRLEFISQSQVPQATLIIDSRLFPPPPFKAPSNNVFQYLFLYSQNISNDDLKSFTAFFQVPDYFFYNNNFKPQELQLSFIPLSLPSLSPDPSLSNWSSLPLTLVGPASLNNTYLFSSAVSFGWLALHSPLPEKMPSPEKPLPRPEENLTNTAPVTLTKPAIERPSFPQPQQKLPTGFYVFVISTIILFFIILGFFQYFREEEEEALFRF